MRPKVAVLLSPPVSAGVGEAPSAQTETSLSESKQHGRNGCKLHVLCLIFFFINFLYNPVFLSSKIQPPTQRPELFSTTLSEDAGVKGIASHSSFSVFTLKI